MIKERFSLLDKEGIRGHRDNYWITKSGKRRLISWRNSSITAPSGSINFIVSIGIDVTDLKQTEAQLHESEARFRDIARASGDWFWEIDENRRFTYLSARYQEVTGTDPADLLGKNLLELGEERGQPEIYRKAFEDAAKQFRAREPYRDIRLDLVDG